MGTLTTKTRNSFRDAVFALPGRRFPVNDKAHARAAKSRASEGVHKGWITPSQKKTIDAKANRKLGK